MPSEAEIEAAIRADLWGADIHAIVDAVCEASDAGDMSTEQCVALGVLLERKRLSAASAVRSEPSREELQRASDAAYVRYINLMQSKPCLGFEAKLASGTFGVAELKAHCEAAEYLGRHRALAALLSQPEPKGDKHG